MNTIAPIKNELGLVPATMTEAMKLADMMASAKLVPAALQKSPADCLMVIQQAIRWQMDPFAVAQECSVIQGKLMHSGKLVAAVVNARGNLTQRLSFEYRGAGDDRAITVSGQLQGEPQPRTVEVVMKNARTQNSVWQKQPDQQLMYHGCRVWARRHTPELMLGVYSPEEFDEPASRRPQPPAPNVMLPLHNPDTGEIGNDPAIASPSSGASAVERPASSEGAPQHDAGTDSDWVAYTERWEAILEAATDGRKLGNMWNSAEEKGRRASLDWPEGELHNLMTRVGDRMAELKGTKA